MSMAITHEVPIMKRLWKTISPCLSDTLGGKQQDGVRIVHSDIRSADIIYGTEEKVLSAFSEGQERFPPPSSSSATLRPPL